MKVKLTVLILFFSISAFSQSWEKIDSLKKELNKVDESEKIKILNYLTWELRNSKIQESIKYGIQAIELAQKLKDFDALSKAYSYTGVAYRNLGSYTEALDFYYKGLKLSKKHNLKEQEGYSYINIGNLYIYQELYSDAENYLNIAFAISDTLQNDKMKAYCYLNIARVDINLKKYSTALNNLDKSLKIRIVLNDINEQAVCYKYMGDVYYYQGKNNEALENYFESLKLSENSKDIDLFADNYNNIAKAYLQKNDFNNARKYAEKSLNSALYIKSKLRARNACMTLMDISKYTNDYKNATRYADKVLLYNDSLHNSQINEKISYIKFIDKQHSYEQKLRERLYEYKLKMQRQKRSRDISFILAAVFIIISFIFFIFFRNKRKINAKLHKKNEKLKETKNEIEKYNRNISDSIDYAKRIQNSILPEEGVLKNVFSEYFIIFKPKDKVSGDFYWWTVNEDYAVISAADCTGHGVPGAFMSMLGLSYLREIVAKEKITDSGLILKNLRNEVINTLKDNPEEGLDISLFHLNRKTLQLQFSGANNPLYLIRKGEIDLHNENISEIKINGINSDFKLYEFMPDIMPISNYIKMDTFNTTEITCKKGDYLYLFSDGFTDQLGGNNNRKFKFNRFRKLLIENVHLPASEQKEILEKTFETWKGDNIQMDDVVILGMKI